MHAGSERASRDLVLCVGLVIRKEGSKYVLRSKDGKKVLGRYSTRAAAEKREKQVNAAKYAKLKK